ncbi:hypothetical protein BWI17_01790 [Betaproteobacteria bacterium GR16-43]|nr:hypothetical protein BWI17_01790 [Betaproteobacteria bacterium GR16-43]
MAFRSVALAALLGLIALLCGSAAQAQEKYWTGLGTTDAWSEKANWSDNEAPRPFGLFSFTFRPSPRNASRNDIAGLEFLVVTFEGNANYALTGTPATFRAITAKGNANVRVDMDATVTWDGFVGAGDVADPATAQPRVEFVRGRTLTLGGNSFTALAQRGEIVFDSNIRELQVTRVQPGGNVTFSGNNSFAGPVSASRSVVTLKSATGFGLPGAGTNVAYESRLEVVNTAAGEMVVDEPIVASSALSSVAAMTASGTGPIRLRGALSVSSIAVSTDLALEGAVTADQLRIDGSAAVTLLNPANAFQSLVVRGTLRMGAAEVLPHNVNMMVSPGGLAKFDAAETMNGLACQGGALELKPGVASLHVTGSVGMDGCELRLAPSPAFAPAPGSVTTLIRNDGASGFLQLFPGYPEGAAVTVNGQAFRLTYTALNGKSLALVAGGPATLPRLQAVSTALQSIPADGFDGSFLVRLLRPDGSAFDGGDVTFQIAPDCGRWTNGLTTATVDTRADGIATAPLYSAPSRSARCQVTATSSQAPNVLVPLDFYVFKASEVRLVVEPARVVAETGKPFTFKARLESTVGLPLPGVLIRVSPVRTSISITTNPARTDGADNSVTVTGIATHEPVSYTIDVAPDFLPAKTVTVVQVPAGYGERPRQDMWWSGPAENGWGMSIVQHADTLFAVIYAYDASGAPTWFVMPGGSWNAQHTTYSGAAYLPSGSPYFNYDVSRFAVGNPIGSIAINFADADHATLSYSLNGFSGTKAIVRQVFAPEALAPLNGLGDMWWGGVSQNGWGIAILQQQASLFSVWFTYDASGKATWFVMPAGAWVDGSYEGRLYRTAGSPWLGAAYDPAALRVIDAGWFRMYFSPDSTLMQYMVDDRLGAMPLVRQPF